MRRTNPHDTLFRAILGRVPDAAGWLSRVVPAVIGDRVSWSELRAASGDDVDRRLRERRTDLVFEAPFRLDGGAVPLRFRVIVEHQTRRDPWIGVRLLDRLVRGWVDHARARRRAGPLPLVLPIVVHSGDEPWTGGELGPTTELGEATGWFLHFRWLHLSTRDPQVVQGTPAARACLGVLGRPDVWRALAAQRDALIALDRVGDEAAIEAVIRYAAQVQSGPMPADLFGGEAEAMTMAKSYYSKEWRAQWRAGRDEGRNEGRDEGRHEALLEALSDVCAARFGEVPTPLLELWRSRPATELKGWVTRLAAATSLNELLPGEG
jgi:hypothetical protein